MVWCGVVWCGVGWCGVGRGGVVWGAVLSTCLVGMGGGEERVWWGSHGVRHALRHDDGFTRVTLYHDECWDATRRDVRHVLYQHDAMFDACAVTAPHVNTIRI